MARKQSPSLFQMEMFIRTFVFKAPKSAAKYRNESAVCDPASSCENETNEVRTIPGSCGMVREGVRVQVKFTESGWRAYFISVPDDNPGSSVD